MTSQPLTQAPMDEPRRALKRSEYELLVNAGVFDGEHVELLEGELLPLTPVGGPHMFAVRRLTRQLLNRVSGRADLSVQGSLALGDTSMPEPDLALIDPTTGAAIPTSASLVVEVADSSLRRDRGSKLRIYARAGVPEYWIVNLVSGVLEVHTQPQPEAGEYGRVVVLRPGDEVTLVAFPDVALAVADLLPPADEDP